ncbi:MAG: hypothetical protein ACE37B_13735 [Ilumatobacter sp.]|jgi:hypothetical protein|uniref:hypothetical protein n=1 Tax=Ilumatobacter sp. TaxID=1967498 RepID=UPI00391DA47C
MRIWKWVGLAGIVGVAAVGITAGTVTVQRKRREFVDAEHDELRVRLHERFAQARTRDAAATGS